MMLLLTGFRLSGTYLFMSLQDHLSSPGFQYCSLLQSLLLQGSQNDCFNNTELPVILRIKYNLYHGLQGQMQSDPWILSQPHLPPLPSHHRPLALQRPKFILTLRLMPDTTFTQMFIWFAPSHDVGHLLSNKQCSLKNLAKMAGQVTL